MKALYTVGHSNLEFQQLIAVLGDAHVELLADVRSRPHSSRFPQFSQPGFEKLLQEEGIGYLFLGEELGGRPDDPDMYRANGVADYRARRGSYAFRAGLERLLQELEARSVALMCAEEDPLECHRFLMICPELVRLGVTPVHLRRGSRQESQESAENRLLEMRGFASVTGNTLFPEARAEALEDAYVLQAEKFAFRVDPAAIDRW
jgi:uncharacterized protein (DUF488 family)